jgi:prophage regulatory protein
MVNPMTDCFIPKHEVQRMTGGLSDTTLWRMRRKGLFPNPVSISPGKKAWRSSDISEWIAARIASPENITA